MRLEDFQREPVGAFARYSLPLTDDAGESSHELLLVGSDDRIKEAFAESDFHASIDPRIGPDEWQADLEGGLRMRETEVASDAFDDLPGLFKAPVPEPSAESSIVCALRRGKPGGTGFTLAIPLFVPAGASVFFLFPRAFVCGASLLPVSGDPDLFLTINGFGGPPVASSTFAGLFRDSVSFSTPPFLPFFPVFRVFGFLASSTMFVGSSFSLP